MEQKTGQTAQQVIAAQVQRLKQALTPLLPRGTPYALVDFPNYANVGDSAIWLGAVALMERLSGSLPRFACEHGNYNRAELAEHHPSGPIFIIGGGNFGDIYPRHQELRIRLMADFPDRDIIQLPQSICFSSPSSVKATADAIARHGRFTMLVRDHASLSFVKENLQCAVDLLPDMAFAMGALPRPVKPSSPLFMLLREDSEKAPYDRAPLQRRKDAVIADWALEPDRLPRLTTWKARFAMAGRGGLDSAKGRVYLYQRLAETRLMRGLKMLASGERVVTDRLHAHILCTMMDIPHVVLDNSYGKITGYMNAWSGTYAQVHRAKTADDVMAQLKAWGL